MEKTIQKFIYVNGEDLSPANSELEDGWIVKSVTVVRSTSDSDMFGKSADSVKFLILLQKNN